MIHLFCNSHYVSHFAASFIVVGAKTSVAESCMAFRQSAAQGERSSKRAPPTHAAQIGLSLAMEADSKGFGCGLKKMGSPGGRAEPRRNCANAQDLQSFRHNGTQSV